jgi:hypothetical protein
MRMPVPDLKPPEEYVAKHGDGRHPLMRDPAEPLYLVSDPRFGAILARWNFETTLGDDRWVPTATLIQEHLGGGRLMTLAKDACDLPAEEAGVMASELRFVVASALHQMRLTGRTRRGVLKSVAPGAERCLKALVKASGQAPIDLAAKHALSGLFTREPSEQRFRRAFAGVANHLGVVETLLADCRLGRRADLASFEDIENATKELTALREARFPDATIIDRARFLEFTPAIKDHAVRIDAFSPVNLTVWKKVRGHIDVLCGEDILPAGWLRFGQASPTHAEALRRDRQRDLALRTAAHSLGCLALAMATLNDPIPSTQSQATESSNDR